MSLIKFSKDIEITCVERNILGNYICSIPDENTEVVYMAWNEIIDANFMKSRPNLKAIIRYGVGYNNVDVEEANRRGIMVCIVPDYGVEEVAQTAVSYIFSHARNIIEYDLNAKQSYLSDEWQKVDSKVRRISDQNVCIIGAGRIGSTAALLLKNIGFNVIFYDPYVAKGYEKVLNIQRSHDLQSALERSDYVTIHVPSNNNKGMVDDSFINKMKRGSVLINTARGEIVENLNCIQRAIESNRLSSVFMDVLECEPPEQHDLLDKWKSGVYGSRVVINPHTSFYSDKSFIEMRTKACISAISVLKGEQPYCEVKK